MNLSKSTANSPTKSYVSNDNSSLQTPQKVKAFTPFASSPLKKSPSSSFFKAYFSSYSYMITIAIV